MGFPGGLVVKNPVANAGDAGPIPAPRRPHMPHGNQTSASQLLKSVLPQEKPPHWEAHARQLENSPHSLQLERACTQQWRPSTAKNKQILKKNQNTVKLKNVSCISLYVKSVVVKVAQSCLTLCNPTNHSPPGSSVHGVLQARILQWIAMPFSRGSFWPRDRTQVSCIAGRFFTIWATRKAHVKFTLNGKRALNRYWPLGNDLYVDIFQRKYTYVRNRLPNAFPK